MLRNRRNDDGEDDEKEGERIRMRDDILVPSRLCEQRPRTHRDAAGWCDS